MQRLSTVLLASSALAAACLCGPAQAADFSEPPPVEPAPVVKDWRFQATFYGWLSGIDGDVGVYGRGPVSVNVSPSEAISDLDGALMASFAAQNDKVVVLTDFMWARIRDSGSMPARGIDFDYTQNQVTIQGALGYILPIDVKNLTLSPTIGFRYQYLDANIKVGPTGIPVSLDAGGSVQWIDPTVGLYAHYDITDKWFINALGDVGGFGIGSKLTWQAFGALGYNWTKTVSTSIGYRAIYEDYQSGGFVYDTTQQGVFAGLGIHF